MLHKFYDVVIAHKDELADLLCHENGKPMKEALGEIDYAASYIRWFAEEARRLSGHTLPGTADDKRLMTIRQPVGVCGLMSAANFPAAMCTRKAAAALAAGCTVVAKLSTDCPLTFLAMAALGQSIFPAGVLNALPCTGENTRKMGELLCKDQRVGKISFTGSTGAGRVLMSQAAESVSKISLELGGNAPFIVMADADIPAAVEGYLAAKLRHSGQTCVCADRLYLHTDIHDQFMELLVPKVRALKLGPGYEEGSDIGPMLHERGVEKARAHVQQAIDAGAKVLVGGLDAELPAGGGFWFAPTILTDLSGKEDVVVEENFAPIIAVQRFSSAEEVIEAANACEVGLAGYLYTRDIATAWRMSEELQVGMVGINTGIISSATAPFGGIKQSGFGREGGPGSILEYTNEKTMTFGGISVPGL